jgi:hypothetical protein
MLKRAYTGYEISKHDLLIEDFGLKQNDRYKRAEFRSLNICSRFSYIKFVNLTFSIKMYLFIC